MKNINWKDIINKVISWGFSATFAILGIALMAVHEKINLPIYAGLSVSMVGVIIYAFTFFIENKVKQVQSDNKALQAKIIELEGKIDLLSTKLNDAQSTINSLMSDNKRKQAKIEKLEKGESK